MYYTKNCGPIGLCDSCGAPCSAPGRSSPGNIPRPAGRWDLVAAPAWMHPRHRENPCKSMYIYTHIYNIYTCSILYNIYT